MKLNIDISIQDLWGEKRFQKNEWGYINYLVGPNATGKTRFVELLKDQCQTQGLKVRYLSSERLSGLEKRRYDYFSSSQLEHGFNIQNFEHFKIYGKNYGLSVDAFVILEQKVDVKIKVEANLSQLFGRRMGKTEGGGSLKHKLRKIDGGTEYDLRESECHGLKELIALLTFLYDDDFNCLILDEPELHLHPQFQTFFLQEIRKLAGNPLESSNKKCFFIVTHSPYFVDIRTVEDLKHCIVFQPNKLPTFIIDSLLSEDGYSIKRLLPKLNTHNKQFFFASRPIFVEGYTDQQIFTLVQEKRGKLLGASGSCIIDGGGKGELDLFFRICQQLNINAQFIVDLDALLEGNLRQSVSKDKECQDYVQTEAVLGEDLMKAIGDAETEINKCLDELKDELKLGSGSSQTNSQLQAFLEAFSSTDVLKKQQYIFLLGLKHIDLELFQKLVPRNMPKLPYIKGKVQKIIEASKHFGMYALSRGELENYCPAYTGNPFYIPNNTKAKVFEQERDFLLGDNLTEEKIRERYGELIDILDEASNPKEVDIREHLEEHVCSFIVGVQRSYKRREIKDTDSLKKNTNIGWQTYSRIFDLLEFFPREKGFTCKIKIRPSIYPLESLIEFNEGTSVGNYQLEEN